MDNKIKLVVIEDEKLLLQAITIKLRKMGIEPVAFESGVEALEYLEKGEIPDAIWLDYYLKDINGLEFVHQLKKVPKLSNIPIIVVSNSASADKVNALMALGIDKYLLKAEYRLDNIIKIISDTAQKKGK